MKKWFRRFRVRQVSIHELDDRMLLVNLYATQIFTLVLGCVVIWLQGRSVAPLFALPGDETFLWWAAGFAGIVLFVDAVLSQWVPEEWTDDGGVNERLFGHRAWWHLIWICFMVSVCEELLFRGGIQQLIGAYWTSILFAVIHVRYLKHWLMTLLVFLISYGLGWIYQTTGTLWTPIAAHFLIDAVMAGIIRYKGEKLTGKPISMHI